MSCRRRATKGTHRRPDGLYDLPSSLPAFTMLIDLLRDITIGDNLAVRGPSLDDVMNLFPFRHCLQLRYVNAPPLGTVRRARRERNPANTRRRRRQPRHPPPRAARRTRRIRGHPPTHALGHDRQERESQHRHRQRQSFAHCSPSRCGANRTDEPTVRTASRHARCMPS